MVGRTDRATPSELSTDRAKTDWDERAFIEHFEAASTDELARILSLPTRREEDALVAYLGPERYARMHERALRRNLSRATEDPSANVVVLHGIMGAELTGTDRTGSNSAIWVRPLRLLAGAIARLQLDPDGLQESDVDWTVRPSAILKKHYGELILSLSEHYRVLPFYYDWRKDLARAGDALNAAITSSFTGDKPIHLVAHSMGGLVARSFIADYPERWKAMRGALVMLGTPNQGSYDIVRALAGRERLIKLLALADFKMSLEELLGVLNSFPGTYQLLPSPTADPAAKALYEKATYGAVNVSEKHLANARATHERLAVVKGDGRMFYIAGYGQATYVGVNPKKLSEDEGYVVSDAGDGRVSLALGPLDKAENWYAPVSHGDLTRDRSVLKAVRDLLESGTTDALEHDAPATRGAGQHADLREELLKRDEHDVTALRGVLRQLSLREGSTRSVRGAPSAEAAVPAEPGRVTEQERVLEDLIVRGWLTEPEGPEAPGGPKRPPPPAIEVTIRHDDIRRAHRSAGDLPVDVIAVGHYAGVKPQYAEAALDEAISEPLPKPTLAAPDERWAITQLTLRGTITGELGQPFLLPDPRAPAERLVAIVGLGLPGRLGSGELTVAVRELVWAIGRLGRKHLASVLIGSGAGNLPEEVAVQAWANGLAQALSGQDEGAPRLERVTIVERDGNRLGMIDEALVKVAERMSREKELELAYTAASKRTRNAWARDGGRAADEQRDPSTSGPIPTRMTISRERRGYRFGAITKDAAIPEREVPLDAALVMQANDELAGEGDDYMRHERGRFLGKLLMPRDLQDELDGSGPVVMILDSTTARIHWELVTRAKADAPSGGAVRAGDLQDYLGVGLGVTRQLRTTFAPPPEPPPPPERLLRVLVVADPAEDAHLPGAEEEGSEVAQIFERVNAPDHPANVEVVRLFGPRQASRTEVLRRLLLERFHVLHFAGHCFYDADEPSASGWIFSDGKTLSANELQRIDRVPEFVFSNACESGITPDRSGERSAELAPSFAESFFARGVGNFVCTAWPVNDAAARTFATKLYSGLLGLDGNPALPMYRAMQQARVQIAGVGGGTRSWGAYQHYGDPLYRLVAPQPDEAS